MEKSDIENYRKCKTNKKEPTAPINIKVHLKMHGNCPKVTDTMTPPNINLSTNHVEEINFKISEIQKYSIQSQETEKDIDSTKEVNSNISPVSYTHLRAHET